MDWKKFLSEFNTELKKALAAAEDDKARQAIYTAATDAFDTDTRQHLIDRGASASSSERRDLRTELADLKKTHATAIEGLKSEIAEAKKGSGDDSDSAKKIADLETQLTEAKQAKKDAVASAQVELDNLILDQHAAEILPHLKEMGVKSESYAALLVKSPDVRKRMKVIRDKDGAVTEIRVTRHGKEDSFIHPRDKESIAKAYAKDLLDNTIPDVEKGTPVAGGTGYEGGSSTKHKDTAIHEQQAKVLDSAATKRTALDDVLNIPQPKAAEAA